MTLQKRNIIITHIVEYRPNISSDPEVFDNRTAARRAYWSFVDDSFETPNVLSISVDGEVFDRSNLLGGAS